MTMMRLVATLSLSLFALPIFAQEVQSRDLGPSGASAPRAAEQPDVIEAEPAPQQPPAQSAPAQPAPSAEAAPPPPPPPPPPAQQPAPAPKAAAPAASRSNVAAFWVIVPGN